jgi:hypothetical protein
MCDECRGWLDGCDRCALRARRRALWVRRAIVVAVSAGAIAFGVGMVRASHDEIPVDFGAYTTGTVRENARALRERPCDLAVLASLADELHVPGGCSVALAVIEPAERRCPQLFTSDSNDAKQTLGLAIRCHLFGDTSTLKDELDAVAAPHNASIDLAVADWHYRHGREELAHTAYHNAIDRWELSNAEELRAAQGLLRTTSEPCHALPTLRLMREAPAKLLDDLRERCQ